MAMIDAYRIGVELVLGGDLATGIQALVPGLERLDAEVAHANAEAAALAAGLHGVAETAPGIGQAADQMSRLSAAMASVNHAVDAWRSHGDMAEIDAAGDKARMSSHRATVSGDVVGLTKEVPEVATGLGAGNRTGAPLEADRRMTSRVGLPAGDGPAAPRMNGALDQVMPALLAGELIERRFVGSGSEDFELSANERTLGGVSPSGVDGARMPGASSAKGTRELYSPAVHVLPDYLRDALAVVGAEGKGNGASVEPLWTGGLKGAVEPATQFFGDARVGEIEEVMPTMTRRERSGAMGDLVVEPRRFVEPPLSTLPSPLLPMAGIERVETQAGASLQGFDAWSADARSAMEPGLDLHRASSVMGTRLQENRRGMRLLARASQQAPAASPSEGLPWPGAAALKGCSTGTRDRRDGTKTALDGLSSSVMALEAWSIKDGLVGRTETEGRGSLVALAKSMVAWNRAMAKLPDEWASNAQDAAAMRAGTPGVAGTGFAPSVTAPYRDHGGRIEAAPHAHGYHPQGDQPGPVIQHITYLHLDDREIARAVTRQQLRMMGSNVSGTLRPDPSIAPQYGAHLLET